FLNITDYINDKITETSTNQIKKINEIGYNLNGFQDENRKSLSDQNSYNLDLFDKSTSIIENKYRDTIEHINTKIQELIVDNNNIQEKSLGEIKKELSVLDNSFNKYNFSIIELIRKESEKNYKFFLYLLLGLVSNAIL